MNRERAPRGLRRATPWFPALAALGVLAASLGVVGGCKSTNLCAPGTLLVTVTFDATTAAADRIDVDVTIPGSAVKTTMLDHKTGMTSGSIEIDFPSDYPEGSAVTVTLTARKAGVVLGTATRPIATLPKGCGTLAIDLGGSGGIDGSAGDAASDGKGAGGAGGVPAGTGGSNHADASDVDGGDARGSGGAAAGGAGGLPSDGGAGGAATGGMTSDGSALPQYALTVAKAGTGTGTVTGPGISCGTDCAELVNYGTTVTLTASAASASGFIGWSGGGCAGTGPCSVIVTGAVTVTATFNVENCRNGVDDDGNGLADCADPACTSQLYHCTSVPSGWSGPVARAQAASAPPACSGDYATSTYSGLGNLSAGTASCTACACNAPVTCGMGGFLLGNLCSTGPTMSFATVVPGDCIVPGFTIQSSGIFRGAAEIASDACGAPSGGALSGASPSFLEQARLCALGATNTGGCGATSVCAPPATGSFDQKLCIYRAGSYACPAGTFSVLSTYYSGLSDTRSCASCTCSGASCGSMTVNWYGAASCAGAPSSSAGVPVTYAGCTMTPSGYGAVRFTGTPAACAPAGGGLMGAVAGTTPVTVCCEP